MWFLWLSQASNKLILARDGLPMYLPIYGTLPIHWLHGTWTLHKAWHWTVELKLKDLEVQEMVPPEFPNTDIVEVQL